MLRSFEQTNRSITLKVTEFMKQPIWANQYIDVNKFIDHKIGQPQKVNSYIRQAIGNLGMWCDVFMVYLTVYCKKYPEQLDPLTSYMAQVKLLCSGGGYTTNRSSLHEAIP